MKEPCQLARFQRLIVRLLPNNISFLCGVDELQVNET